MGEDSSSGSQVMPHKEQTSRTRGVIHPRVEEGRSKEIQKKGEKK